MNRRLISCLMLVVLALQSVTAMSAETHIANPYMGANNMSADVSTATSQPMQHDCAEQTDAPVTPPDCCNDGCDAQLGCATACAVYSLPAFPSLVLTASSNDESFAFVARVALSRDYPPLNPPPNA